MNNENSYYCHKGNGWNYGIQFSGKDVRIFRYNANGSQNSDYEHGPFVEFEKLKKELGEERIKKIMEEGKDGGQLERLFFNGF